MISSDQIRVTAGMVAAAIVTAGLFTFGADLCADLAPKEADAAGRLSFVAQWLILPGLSVLLVVGCIANRRFFDAEAIAGTRPMIGKSLDIDLRVLSNTVEQAISAALVYPAFVLFLPQKQLGLIPALSVTFLVARFAFWLGYHIAPSARAFGFALTFYPTIVVYAWLLFDLIRHTHVVP